MHDPKTNKRNLPHDPVVVKRSRETALQSRPIDEALSSAGHVPPSCLHDGALQCSLCGALLAGAEICPDPAGHHAPPAKFLLSRPMLLPPSTPPTPSPPRTTYNTDWPRDPQGYAQVTFTNVHSGR